MKGELLVELELLDAEQQVYRDLGWELDAPIDPESVETQEPSDRGYRLAEDLTPVRRPYVRALGNFSMAAIAFGSSFNLHPSCPTNEVLANGSILATQVGLPHQGESLRVSTLNTHGSKGEELNTFINTQHSDLFGLQEVTTDSLEAIIAGTDYEYGIMGRAVEGENGEAYGVALLTNLPVINYRTFQISSDNPDIERRVALVATLDNDGQELIAVVTHFINQGGEQAEERLYQTRELMRILGQPEYLGKPTTISVDVNAEPFSDPRHLLEVRYDDGPKEVGLDGVITLPVLFSNRSVDTVLTYGLDALDLSRWGDEDISDHCGITVTLVPEL